MKTGSTSMANDKPTHERILDVSWPTPEMINGEVPPAGTGIFVCARTPGAGINRNAWHGSRESALDHMRQLDAASANFYVTAGLHWEAPTPTIDSAAVFASTWVDADVEHLGEDGNIRHAGSSKNRDGAKTAVAQFATVLLPAPRLIVGTSDSGGVQAWYPLDRWTDADAMQDVCTLMASLAAKTEGRIDSAVYSLDQRLRAGGPATTTEHASTLTTVVDADALIAAAVKDLDVLAPTRERTGPLQWIDGHPEVAESLLAKAGWSKVGRVRRHRGNPTQLWKHPKATHAYSASLTSHGDSWTFVVYSPLTDFQPRPKVYSPIATVAVLLGHHEGGVV
jgi:hypothetical protein